MEKRSHFREAKSFAGTSSRTFGGPLSESNSASLGFCTCFATAPQLSFILRILHVQCLQQSYYM